MITRRCKFNDIVLEDEGLLKWPFGSDLKISLYVPEGNTTYKVYLQENILKRDISCGNHYISEEYFKNKMKRYEVSDGDFIVTCDGTLGEIFQLNNIKERWIISSSLLRITLNKELVDEKFFPYFWLKRIKYPLISSHDNSVLKHLPGLKAIREFELDLPNIQDQQKIASILSVLDKKIELNNNINAELEAIAKTLYDYWFVQFNFPDENGKPYKSNGGKLIWSEELKRNIPKEWEVKKVCDLLPVITGKKDANFATENGEYNFFTCWEEILKCDTFEFEWKAVLVAGNWNFNIKLYEGKFNAYQRTYILIPNDEKYYTLIFMAVKDRIASLSNSSRGSIVKFITKWDLEDIQIVLPKDGNLDIFSQLNSITKKIEQNLEENQKLSELRDWLLPMLMNGQVVVNEL